MSINNGKQEFKALRLKHVRQFNGMLDTLPADNNEEKVRKEFADYIETNKNLSEVEREAFVSALSYAFFRTESVYSGEEDYPDLKNDIEKYITAFYNDESGLVRAEAVRCVPVYEMDYGPHVELHLVLCSDNTVHVRATILGCISRDLFGDYRSKKIAGNPEYEYARERYVKMLTILEQDADEEIAKFAKKQIADFRREIELEREKRRREEQAQEQSL